MSWTKQQLENYIKALKKFRDSELELRDAGLLSNVDCSFNFVAGRIARIKGLIDQGYFAK